MYQEIRKVGVGFLSCILILDACYCIGQQTKIDSLRIQLKSDKEDTNKVNHLNALGWQLMYNDPDTSIILGNQSLQLAEKLNWKKGIASSLGNQGVYCWLKTDYPQALDYYLKALKIDEELKDKNGMAKRLSNIGNIYAQQGDYPKALDYYFKALKMKEEIGAKNEIAKTLGNIGGVFTEQKDFQKALEYYFKALKIGEEIGDKGRIAIQLGNIGIVYQMQAGRLVNKGGPELRRRDSLYGMALDYYFRRLKMDEESGNQNNMAINLGNIGGVYQEQGDYSKSLDYYFRALKIAEGLESKININAWLGNIGSLYTSMMAAAAGTEKGALASKAEKYLSDALKADKELGAPDYERQDEESLSELYEKTNRYQLALEHYKKAMSLKDTLFSQEKNKEITRKEMNYEFEKKEAAAKAEQEKQAAVAAAEKQRQRIVLILVSCVLFLVLIFAGFVFRALRITNQQKGIIEEQKKHVEEKQKEILDSIHYARRIQTALLPTEKYIDKSLNRLMNCDKHI